MKGKLVVIFLFLSFLFGQSDAKAGGADKALKLLGKFALDVAAGLTVNKAQAMIDEKDDRNNENEAVDEELSDYYIRMNEIAMEMKSFALEEHTEEAASEKISYFLNNIEKIRSEVESRYERDSLKKGSDNQLFMRHTTQP